MSPPNQPARIEFILIAVSLIATVALAIDILLPAMEAISNELGVASGNSRQWIIIAVLGGLAVGQLFFGPLSDSIGRRRAIFFGAVTFTLGSMVCAFSHTFESFILGRIIQGFGAAGPRIVTVALIRDRFIGAPMARIMSYILGVFILVPIMAPTASQWLLTLMPWRGLFTILALLGLAGAAWLYLRQPETLRSKIPLSGRTFVAATKEIFGDRRVLTSMCAGGFYYGALIGYVTSSQQLFQSLYGVGDQYAILFGATAVAVAIGTFVNVRLLRFFAMGVVCIFSSGALAISSLAFLIAITFAGAEPPLVAFLLFIFGSLFLLGLTFGNFSAIAMLRLGHIAGVGSAVVSSGMTLIGVLVASLIGFSFNMSVYPLVFGFFVVGVVVCALMVCHLENAACKGPKLLSKA